MNEKEEGGWVKSPTPKLHPPWDKHKHQNGDTKWWTARDYCLNPTCACIERASFFFFFFFLALFWIWPIHFIYSFTNYNLYYYSFIANVFFWDLQRNPFFVFKSQNQPICQILNELAVQNVTRCNRVRLDHDLVPPLTLCIKFFAQSMCKGSTFMTQNWNFGYNNTL